MKRPQNDKIQNENLMEFCKNQGIIGTGYNKIKCHDEKLLRNECNSKYSDKKIQSNAYRHIHATSELKVNDLIWTRVSGSNNEYYLCRVTKEWNNFSENDVTEEHKKFDMCHFVGVEFIKIGGMEEVPGRVSNSFIWPATYRKIKSWKKENNKWIESHSISNLSCTIWNKKKEEEFYSIKNLGKEDFFEHVDSEDLECFVILYLQYKYKYMIYSTTCKLSTPKYEIVLVNRSGERATVQVKSNKSLDINDYIKNEKYQKIFLFTTSGVYNNIESADSKISLIDKIELYNFIIKNKKLLPVKYNISFEE